MKKFILSLFGVLLVIAGIIILGSWSYLYERFYF